MSNTSKPTLSLGRTSKTAAESVPTEIPLWEWEGKDKHGRILKNQIRAESEVVAKALLRKQGIQVTQLKKQKQWLKKRITEKDIVFFTRQLCTMLKSGVPLLQAFDITARGHHNPAMTRLLLEVRQDIEMGLPLSEAFARHPKYFDTLFCSMIAAGEAGGVLEALLDKLASYKEKTLAIKGKIKSALIYPSAIILTAFVITAVIMIYVVPAFKDLFSGFGAELPAPTAFVIWLSNLFVDYWWAIFGGLIGGIVAAVYFFRRSEPVRQAFEKFIMKTPVIGNIIIKATIARWARTLATLFTAGVPLVEALDSVAGASGNYVFAKATEKIQEEVKMGSTLQFAMQMSGIFPNMVLQMTAIGEESGALDDMLSKAADFYEEEVDNAVASLSSLLEPVIMVVLGVLIGGLVVAMYLPIFKMGDVVG